MIESGDGAVTIDHAPCEKPFAAFFLMLGSFSHDYSPTLLKTGACSNTAHHSTDALTSGGKP